MRGRDPLKYRLYALILVGLIGLPLLGQAQPRANVETTLMQPMEGARLVRTMVAVADTSLSFAPKGDGLQQLAIIDFSVRQGEKLIAQQQVQLSGPVVSARDTLDAPLSFLIDQFSVLLAPGQYAFDIRVKDGHNEALKAFAYSGSIQLDDKDMQPLHSDAVFYSTLNRAGESTSNRFRQSDFELVPRPQGTAFIGEDTLQFYWEVYNADKLIGEPYFTEVQLLAASTRNAVAGHRMLLKPEAPSAFTARAIDMDISDLPSQTYLLDVQFKTNAGVRKGGFQQKFFVFNPKAEALDNNEQAMFDVVYGYTEAQLDSFIPTMTFLMNDQQKIVMKGLETYDEKKAFFYNFWARLKAKPDNPPGLEWQNYYSAVRYANQNFESQLREGWRTDRGRVMLQYGPPNNVQAFFDPRNYIIWEYDNLMGQSGVIFLFNATERSSNEYWLVHSTLRGEIFNAAVADELQNMLDGNSPYLEQTPMILPSTTGATRHRD